MGGEGGEGGGGGSKVQSNAPECASKFSPLSSIKPALFQLCIVHFLYKRNCHINILESKMPLGFKMSLSDSRIFIILLYY